MKKFLSIALSIIMALCVMPAGVAFAGGESTITAGNSATVTLDHDGDTYVLLFTPQRTSVYRIASHAQDGADPKCDIFDSKGEPIASCDDVDTNGVKNVNFEITHEFTKGEEYTIVCGGNNIKSGISYVVEVVDTTPGKAPDAPANLKASDITKTSVKLDWDDVDGAAKYIVYDPSTEPVTAVEITKSEYTFKNLKAETEYSLKVVAISAEGLRSETAEIIVKTLGDLPDAPNGFKVEDINSTSFKLVWEKANHADEYDVYIVNGDSKELVGTTADTSFVLTDLTPSQDYTIAVVAKNEYGTASAETSARTAPASPEGLAVSNITQTGFSLDWDDVANASIYRVVVSDKETSQHLETRESKYDVTDLVANTKYTVTVVAEDEEGLISDEAKTEVTTLKEEPSGEKPSAPTGYNVYARGNGGKSLYLEWNASANADGYKVYIVSGGKDYLKGDVKENKFTFTDLTPSWEYDVKVVAYNNYGSASSMTTVGAAPAAPTGLKAASSGNTITATWDVASCHGYYIQWATDESFKNVVGGEYINGSGSTSYSININGSQAYYVRVRTWKNYQGSKLYSDFSAPVKSGATPSAPTGYNVYARGNGGKSLYLEWNADPNADGYKVYIVSGGKDNLKGDVKENKFTFTDLTPSWEYNVKVVAYNDYGTSSSMTTVGAAPAAPVGLEVEANENTIKATWDVASCHGYYIQWATDKSFSNVVGGEYINGSGSTSYTINADSSQSYYVRVRTWKNYQGSKLYSDFSAPVKSDATPSAPTGYNVYARGNGGKALYLEWNASDNAEGYKVYIVSGNKEYFKGDVKENKFTFTDLTPSWEYNVKVVAYNDYGTSSSMTTVGAAPAAPVGLEVEANGNEIHANWNVASCHGYYIQWATDESFKNVVGGEYINGSGSTNYTINVDGSQTYYVRVRTWKNYQGSKLYSDFSAPVVAE